MNTHVITWMKGSVSGTRNTTLFQFSPYNTGNKHSKINITMSSSIAYKAGIPPLMPRQSTLVSTTHSVQKKCSI